MQTTNWSRDLGVEVRGDDVVSHTGSVIVRMLADKTGLTSALSGALARPEVIHDRGAVFRDLAVTIADGGTHICDLAVLGNQQRVFGPVASTSTMWRALNEIDTNALTGITAARNKVRRKVWELIVDRHGMIPPVQTCYGDLGEVIGIRIDATLVNSYSDKQLTSGNFKGGYGFHPLTSWCDNTGESLAIIARTATAGSNTAADHIAIIDASIAALPVAHRRRLLITIDGAGSTHDVLDHLAALHARRGYTVEYSVGFDLDARVRGATAMPEDVWSDVLDPPVRPATTTRASRRSPACCATATAATDSPGGPTTCGCSCAANRSSTAPNCHCSSRPTDTATSRSRPTPAQVRPSVSRPVTASTPASRVTSAAQRTPAWPLGRPPRSTSTGPGSPPWRSRSTCCAGPDCCCSRAP